VCVYIWFWPALHAKNVKNMLHSKCLRNRSTLNAQCSFKSNALSNRSMLNACAQCFTQNACAMLQAAITACTPFTLGVLPSLPMRVLRSQSSMPAQCFTQNACTSLHSKCLRNASSCKGSQMHTHQDATRSNAAAASSDCPVGSTGKCAPLLDSSAGSTAA